MEQKYLSIGKTAKLMNVSIKALRFYDRIGLLKPGYIDPETKYRYYCFDQLMSIHLIKAARNLDISPKALVPYFEERDTDRLVELMQNHRDMLSDKMKQLRKTLDQIETLEALLKVSASTDKSGEIYTRALPDRYVITYDIHAEQSEEEILKSYYQLNAALNQRALTYLYEDGVIYSFDKNTLQPVCIYSNVLKEDSLTDYRLLPGGTYICTAFHKENAEKQYNKLLEYVINQGIEPQLVIQTELLTDLFTDTPEYFEIQIKAEPLP